MRALSLLLLTLTLGCKKPVAPEREPPPPPPEPEVVEDEVPEQVEEAVEVMIRNFQRVHFAFDSTELAGESQSALSENAKIMQEFPSLGLEIQGHADERGTTEYNLALGQQRAKALSVSLGRMGIGGERIKVVSYGEERPAVPGSSEVAWSQNRRAEFRVTRGNAPVQGTLD